MSEQAAIHADAGLLQSPAAFAELVRQHQKIVLGLAQALGLKGADLDDAAAEVFVQVYRALPSFQGRSSVGTWIYQIATRTLRRYRAKLGRRPVQSEAVEHAVDGKSDSPTQASLDREQSHRLWQAVANLEPRQAMAVELFYRRGWTVQTVAQVMDCPEGTIKTLLFRARRELRDKLESLRP